MPSFVDPSESIKSAGSTLLIKANELRSFAENNPLSYKALTEQELQTIDPDVFNYNRMKKDFRAIIEEQERQDERVKKSLTENEFRTSAINDKIDQLEAIADKKIKNINEAFEASMTEAEEKRKQINDILGHVSGRAIAGDFDKNASDEKIVADWLRIGSLSFMLIIALLLGLSFWETTKTDFDWQKSIFRIALTFLLSVPAAYLARESAKHRQQQYQHLQTSLDLKALSPFTASLPESDQHKLKIDIAARIFSAKDFSKVGADPYPLNTHEIIMELIKKIDIKPSSKTQNTDTAPKPNSQ